MKLFNPRVKGAENLPNGGYSGQDYMMYPLDWSNIAGGNAGDIATINVNVDSDFYVTCMSFWVSSNLTFVTNPVITWMLTDAGSNKNLFGANAWLDANAGNGQLPFQFPIVRRFAAGSTIQGTLYNKTTATTYDNIQIQLHGVRAYL